MSLSVMGCTFKRKLESTINVGSSFIKVKKARNMPHIILKFVAIKSLSRDDFSIDCVGHQWMV